MSNPVLTAIADRRSIRAYSGDQLTQEQLDAILKAARESPSALNAQPWHFSVVQKPEILKEVNEEARKILGGMVEHRPDIFYAAPTVIFASCDAESRWGRLDCGIALQTMALAAHSLGLGSVILGLPDAAFTGPRKDYFNRLLKFPAGYSFAAAIAIGVPAATKEAHPQEPDRITFV
ncbi:MAG: nitroreductase [Treponema sp.]|jgi:nitroreductase|nr:nitroreductase [Treponema sp.]